MQGFSAQMTFLRMYAYKMNINYGLRSSYECFVYNTNILYSYLFYKEETGLYFSTLIAVFMEVFILMEMVIEIICFQLNCQPMNHYFLHKA